ncbi:MAG: hypothetical protein M5U10_16105 [Candidatus Methanoperedens sp.]|uniref:hypothetical protein n=1 Tax=Candidatus Methanoperedens nitratireducens TaxID=1392998 RepID=UPI0012FEBC91|nr:hypothetical protein [Candidatus Methanoperedens nitroreducens]MDJ1423419.1 hypothetical protein [Candidatus Methanoperedens sp.]
MDKISTDESAMIGLDLMVALTLIIAAVIISILIMPTLSHEDRDWRIKQYMTATRATDNLVQDDGGAWETNWNRTEGNYSNVTKIGFIYVGSDGAMQKVLSIAKVEALMGQGYEDNVTKTTWWEFPNSSAPDTSPAERENATRALGLTGYNFYMQLHPVGLNPALFNSTPLETNISKSLGNINLNTVSVVDRYVYIKDSTGNYLEFDNEAVHYRLNLWVW